MSDIETRVVGQPGGPSGPFYSAIKEDCYYTGKCNSPLYVLKIIEDAAFCVVYDVRHELFHIETRRVSDIEADGYEEGEEGYMWWIDEAVEMLLKGVDDAFGR